MNAPALTVSQVRYVNKAFWRNPESAFFTFAFPLMFLVIFTALLGHSTVHLGTKIINTSTYYVAAMASFAVISACFTNIAISVSFQRDSGVLKRINGTPLPSTVYVAARIVHALLIAVLLVIITTGMTVANIVVTSQLVVMGFLLITSIIATNAIYARSQK